MQLSALLSSLARFLLKQRKDKHKSDLVGKQRADVEANMKKRRSQLMNSLFVWAYVLTMMAMMLLAVRG